MGRKPGRLSAFILACGAAGFAAAADPDQVVAQDLDVAGVRIGMSQEQAVRAASDRLQVDRKAIQFASSPSTSTTASTIDRTPAEYFSIRTGKETLIVHFVPRLPAEPQNPQVVDHVTYEMPPSARNETGMRQAALEKYGPPSNGTRGFSLEWCLKSAPNPGNPGIGCLQAPGAVLKLSGTRIDLSDRRLQDAVTDYLARQQNRFARF